MIDKIGLNLTTKQQIKTTPTKHTTTPQTLENTTESPISNPKLNGELLSQYYVSFKGKKRGVSKTNETSYETKVEDIYNNATPKSVDILDRASSYAKNIGSKEVNQLHLLRIILEDTIQELDELDSGERFFDDETELESTNYIESSFGEDIFRKPEMRKRVRPIIEEEIAFLDKELQAQADPTQKTAKKAPQLAKDLVNDITSLYEQENQADSIDGDILGDGLLHDHTLIQAVIETHNMKIKRQYAMPFSTKMKDASFVDNTPLEQRTTLSFYEDKAKNIWKNLAIGTNMMVLHEPKVNTDYFVNSFIQVFNKPENKFGRLNKDNTEVTVLKYNEDIDYMLTKMRYASKDKSKTHVFVMDITTKDLKVLAVNAENAKDFGELPPNIKFVMIADKDIYYNQTSNEKLSEFFGDFGEVHVPIMNVPGAKKAFRENPELMKKVKKTFSPKAMDKVIEATAQLPGHYPEKAQKIFELIAAYYVEKEKDITLKDVQEYIKAAKEVFKDVENDSTLKIILDTGVKLKDLVGTPTSKKEAKAIIRGINEKSIGTKGYVIFAQDSSVGGGRKHTAKAIAGETKSPYIEINAMDFGTKDIDLFGIGNLSPEKSIKKLFGLVKAQAETNKHKSAVIFIERFEHFSVGEWVSEFHQKAMAQLLREMDTAQSQGYNIVVMGSTNMPDWVDDSTIKSKQFIDKIEVDSPMYNKAARKEIIEYYIKKKNIKLAAPTQESYENIINHITATADHMTYNDILTLLDKAKTVAKERNHKEIQLVDFTEAYLQITCGRPSESPTLPHNNAIVTSHECGHALNTVVMYNLMSSLDKPWRLPEDLNFITLDPRSIFGGAVFTKESENRQYSFERVFSDIVVSFGGLSCERHFFGMDGSWGPTCDLEQATKAARSAIERCGMGKHFGRKSLPALKTLSERDRNNINKDIEVMLKNAEAVSDLITATYDDFNKEFTAKYKDKCGTGECIINGQTFKEELKDWIARQPESVKESIALTDRLILDIIEKTKQGIIY